MRLLILNDDYDVEVAPEVIPLVPFNALYKRDKTKGKSKFRSEMSFIWHLCNATSDYQYITDEGKRSITIKTDLAMIGKDGEVTPTDKKLQEAIDFYKSFRTITESLYFGASIAADAVNAQLKNSKALLQERDPKTNKLVYSFKEILAATKEIPTVMRTLKSAYKEVVLEQKETDGRSKGSQDFNRFEDGFDDAE